MIQKTFITYAVQAIVAYATTYVVDQHAPRNLGELPSAMRVALQVVQAVGLEYTFVFIERALGPEAEQVKDFIHDFIEHED